MKIRVMHENGTVETLTLRAPLHVSEGVKLDRIGDAAGCDHFFTKDGFYDGWGRAMGDGVGVAHPEEARRLIEKLESGRTVEKPLDETEIE